MKQNITDSFRIKKEEEKEKDKIYKELSEDEFKYIR